MLAIKLQRIGKKHQPSYRVVVAEKRSKLGGPPVEDLGSYNPATKQLHVTKERVEYLLKVGVTPTTSVHNLFVKHGVVSGEKLTIKIRKARATDGEVKPAEPVADKASGTEAPAA